MKKLLFLLILVFVAVLFNACPPPVTPVSCVGGDYTLNIYDAVLNDLKEMDVCTIKESTNANFVMVKNDMGNLNQEQLDDFSNEFNNNIYPKVTSAFGTVNRDVDSNGKVIIVMFDVNDGDNSIRGFMNPDDMDETFDPGWTSNNGEYFYVDVANFSDTTIKSTMAHEFQHVINQSWIYTLSGAGVASDTWLDESLAMAAEHLVYGGDVVMDRVQAFNTIPEVKNGRGLLDWQNSDVVVANYALSYLFMQWVRYEKDGGNGDNIYKNIINNVTGTGTIGAVTNATGTGFEDLLKGWAADNFTDTTYGGRLALAVEAKLPSSMPSTIKPGAILYDPINDCGLPSPDCDPGTEPNIRQIGVDNSGTLYSDPDDASATKSFVCNVNSDDEGAAENIGNWYAFGAEPPVLKMVEQFTAEQLKLIYSYNPIVRRKDND